MASAASFFWPLSLLLQSQICLKATQDVASYQKQLQSERISSRCPTGAISRTFENEPQQPPLLRATPLFKALHVRPVRGVRRVNGAALGFLSVSASLFEHVRSNIATDEVE